MFKKLIVLALAAGVSASASAGYIQYEVKDARFDDGLGLSGYFVQNTDTNGIAYAALATDSQYYTPNTDLKVVKARIAASGAPTSFDALSRFTDNTNLTRLSLEFGAGTTLGTYSIRGTEVGTRVWRPGHDRFPSHSLVTGFLEVGQIDPELLAALQAGTAPFREVVPPRASGLVFSAVSVPEPAGLALFAAGLALMGRQRSRVRHARRQA